MNFRKMNPVLSILGVVAISALSAQNASATSPTCTAMMATMADDYSINIGVDPSLLQTTSAIGLSYVGLMVGYVGGARDFLRNGGGNSASASGTALTAIGIGLFLRGLSDLIHVSDATREFRRSEHYSCIRAELGQNRSEEFVADLFSGWSSRRLAQKYLPTDEQALVLDQIAYLESLNVNQSTL